MDLTKLKLKLAAAISKNSKDEVGAWEEMIKAEHANRVKVAAEWVGKLVRRNNNALFKGEQKYAMVVGVAALAAGDPRGHRLMIQDNVAYYYSDTLTVVTEEEIKQDRLTSLKIDLIQEDNFKETAWYADNWTVGTVEFINTRNANLAGSDFDIDFEESLAL